MFQVDGKVSSTSDVIGVCEKCHTKIRPSRGEKVLSVRFSQAG